MFEIGEEVYVVSREFFNQKIYKTTILSKVSESYEVYVLDLPIDNRYHQNTIFRTIEELIETIKQGLI